MACEIGKCRNVCGARVSVLFCPRFNREDPLLENETALRVFQLLLAGEILLLFPLARFCVFLFSSTVNRAA